MTQTGFTLDDLGYRLSGRSLYHFAIYLPYTSKTWAAMNPSRADESSWGEVDKLPMLTAQLCDELAAFHFDFAQANSKHSLRGKEPEPIKRPGIVDNVRRFGSEPIPISEFDEWWENN